MRGYIFSLDAIVGVMVVVWMFAVIFLGTLPHHSSPGFPLLRFRAARAVVDYYFHGSPVASETGSRCVKVVLYEIPPDLNVEGSPEVKYICE